MDGTRPGRALVCARGLRLRLRHGNGAVLASRGENLEHTLPPLDLILVESGGDNLTATFSRGLIDYQIFVVDVAGGDKVPARADPASPAPTCSWSTRPTSPPRSAPIWT